MIRRSQLLQSGVVVEDGPTLDEIHEEEKAVAAATEVEDVDVLAAAEASADLSEVGRDDLDEEQEISSEQEDEGAKAEDVPDIESSESSDDSNIDYESMTVSNKILKAVLSNIDYINRTTWYK